VASLPSPFLNSACGACGISVHRSWPESSRRVPRGASGLALGVVRVPEESDRGYCFHHRRGTQLGAGVTPGVRSLAKAGQARSGPPLRHQALARIFASTGPGARPEFRARQGRRRRTRDARAQSRAGLAAAIAARRRESRQAAGSRLRGHADLATASVGERSDEGVGPRCFTPLRKSASPT
jgi:hypothetical protein